MRLKAKGEDKKITRRISLFFLLVGLVVLVGLVRLVELAGLVTQQERIRLCLHRRVDKRNL